MSYEELWRSRKKGAIRRGRRPRRITPSEISIILHMIRKPNRPFPSSKKSHFQTEAKCETFVVKMSFICIIIENHFHINGFALSLVLKVRFFGTRKWPIQ